MKVLRELATQRTGSLVSLAFALTTGCGEPAIVSDAAVPRSDARVAPAETEPPAPPSEDWCRRLRGGSAGTHAAAVDLSAAHFDARFFSATTRPAREDQALASALEPQDALSSDGIASALARYDTALEEVCAVSAEDARLGAARVAYVDRVAIVRPGTGKIPPIAHDTALVVLDLRALPNTPELPAALASAAAMLLTRQFRWSRVATRRFHGMVDEVFSRANVYTSEVHTSASGPAEGLATRELPLVVATGATMAPEAARLAFELRLASRAWLVGEGLLARVAESRWHGVGRGGLAVRVMELRAEDGTRWPDALAADRRVRSTLDDGALARVAREVAAQGAVPPATATDPQRAELTAVQVLPRAQSTTVTRGALRAALIATHGALRAFFPYFAVVGDTIDARLWETLGTTDAFRAPPTREVYRNTLRRFGEAIHDGHNFVFDFSSDGRAQLRLPIALDLIDGLPVVYRASAGGPLRAGDTLLARDGEPMRDWLAREYLRTSAASEGYRFDLASREMLYTLDPVTFRVRDADGAEREARLAPVGQPAADEFGSARFLRGAGRLGDLGAPEMHYINLADEVLTTPADALAALTAAQGARGLVLDMRGYPDWSSTLEVVHRIVEVPVSSPIFRTPVVDPWGRFVDESSYDVPPTAGGARFTGPVVVLVGATTVSRAENFVTMLVNARRVRVVGRPSAATNGNITGLQLPGAMGFTFTGMEVLYADRRTFHGVGIVPDVLVPLRVADLRAGRDADLSAAIAELRRVAARP